MGHPVVLQDHILYEQDQLDRLYLKWIGTFEFTQTSLMYNEIILL